jgi:hypothetical protein
MIGLPIMGDCHYGRHFYAHYVLINQIVFNIIFIEQGGLIMRINIHDTTPASKTPKFFVWIDIDIVNITLHFFLKDVRSMLPPAVNHSIAVS